MGYHAEYPKTEDPEQGIVSKPDCMRKTDIRRRLWKNRIEYNIDQKQVHYFDSVEKEDNDNCAQNQGMEDESEWEFNKAKKSDDGVDCNNEETYCDGVWIGFECFWFDHALFRLALQ